MARMKFEQFAINKTQKRIPTEADMQTYIGLEHLDSGSLTVTRWGSDVPIKGEKLIMKKGDVLLGKRNAYLRRAAVCPHDGLFSAHGMVLNPIEDVMDPDFFPFFIASDYFFDEAIRISVGSLSPTINWKDLAKLEFNIPPIEKQRDLAEILQSIYLTKEAYRNLMNRTDELVKSQFIEMFGLTKDNVHGFDSASIVDVCDFQGGSQPPKKDWVKQPTEGFVRMLQIRDFTQSEKDNVEYVKDSRALKKCVEKDILIGRYGASVGKILKGLSGAYNVAIMKTIPDEEKLNRTYLYCYFLGDEFQSYILSTSASRAAQAGFSKEDLRWMNILLPPMELQVRFEKFIQQSDKSKFMFSNRNLSRCLETPW